MHIPEGFIAPSTYIPLALIDGALLWYSARHLRTLLTPQRIPMIALMSAAIFVLSSIMIPLPFGTSAHLVGIGLLVALFGWRMSLLIYTMVLLMQFFLLGQGGLSTFFVTLFSIGVVGGGSAKALLRLTHHHRWGYFGAGSVAVLVAALTSALLLGAQSYYAVDEQGAPLFFPFGWEIVVPTMLGAHLIVALIEGIITRYSAPYWHKRVEDEV